jgi:type 2 lantibiotic biosynthesis protein LanM
MSQTNFSPVDAYRAFTLSERIASSRAIKRVLRGPSDRELAQRRLHTRKLHEPFSTDDFLAQWLSEHGLTEEEFLFFLGEQAEALPAAFPNCSSWMQELRAGVCITPQTVPDSLRSVFTEVVWPNILVGIRKVEAAVAVLAESRGELPFDPHTVENLFLPGLSARLRSVIERSLVLELNVARLQDLLTGETPEDRFRSFLDRMHDSHTLMSLYSEYPVLARHVVLAVEQWTSSSIELLERLCQDSGVVAAHFKLQRGLGKLNQLKLSTGDRHRGGRSVAILGFDSGLQLVYKPKPLAVDLHFQQLLRWINRRTGEEEFKTFEVVDRNTYGWVEFVPFRSCTSRKEIQRFYERLGGYLALLYALEANDFHSENIVASGEYPVLIDLECLFQARMPANSEPRTQSYFGLSDTAMRVGILPNRSWSDDEAAGLEVSGLGGAAGQLTPKGMPAWKDAGTDTMRLERQRLAIAGSQNQPTLNDEPVDVFDYAESITNGFTRMYGLVTSAREDLLSASGPLSAFLNDEVRVLFRPTRTYVRLLYESFHPDVLRDELDRECLLDRIWEGIDGQPYLTRIVPAELRALQNQDVPLFTARVSSRDLCSGDGERFPGFLEKSGIECVHERLQQLNESDLGRQLWFVKSSLATLTVAADQARWPTYTLVEPSEPVSAAQILRAACAIGDRLESIALREANEATWVGLAFANEGHWVLRPLSPEFYSGLSGIILFLATLGEVAHEPRYTLLARAALAMVNRQLEKSPDTLKSVGAYTGWGGLIYCYTHLSALWNEEHWRSQALRLVQLLPPLIAKDTALDVTGGSAGCIAALLCLYRCVPDAGLLKVATQCGDRLVDTAVPLGDGMIGWPSPVVGARPLGGFSHGAGGCSWALLQLYAMTGQEQYRSSALQAIQYERSLYSPEAGNWRDLRGLNRANPDPNQFRIAWCHGASGLGLARLGSLRFLDDSGMEELDVALKTTLDKGFGTNHSLCHGDLGNLDLLLQAAEVVGGRWKKEAQRMAGIILESIRQHGWLSGVPLGVETPGLMTGLAGIGYGLLRAAFPDRIASVLTLEPPKRATQTSR